MILKRSYGDRWFIWSLIGIYAAVYGGFLVISDGLPYVLDGNESFSSLWHAINLYHFGFGQSYGITDEAYGFSSAAHPYVYTHQGNFPRLFAFLIYVLGARTIESQIVVTTFTVGLTATLFCYRFFARVLSPLFAFVACLVMITDYLLVAQWQVVTYRVWHEFFIFSSLLCVHMASSGRRGWPALTLINFACLFYFEFIFVAFVSLCTAIYATWILRDRTKLALVFLACVGAGAIVGLGVLATQLVLYLGWDDFIHDAYLTFVARNRYLGDPYLLDKMREFFSSHNIAFWYNLEDGNRFRTLGYFIASLTHYEFQIHTPLFTNVTWIIVSGFVTAELLRRMDHRSAIDDAKSAVVRVLTSRLVIVALLIAFVHAVHKWWRGDFGSLQLTCLLAVAAAVLAAVVDGRRADRHAPEEKSGGSPLERQSAGLAFVILATIAPSLVQHVSSEKWLLDRYSVYFTAYGVVYLGTLICSVFGVVRHWGRTREPLVRVLSPLVIAASLLGAIALASMGNWDYQSMSENGWVYLSPWVSRATIPMWAIAGVIAVAALVYLRTTGRWALVQTEGITRGVLFFGVIAVALTWTHRLYNPHYEPLWDDLMRLAAPGILKHVFLYLSIFVATMLVIRGSRSVLHEIEWSRINNLVAFLVSGLAAYAIVFIISPGYVFTGYRFRIVPFTVFHTNVIVALAFFLLLVLAIRARNEDPSRRVAGKGAGFGDHSPRGENPVSIRVAATVLLVLTSWYWGAVQARYLQLIPPDNYHFLRVLEQPPYLGKSFVVNTYAAPVAAATREWAYLHLGLAEGKLPEESGRLTMEMDSTYLWFADKDSNPAYRYPDYFICITPQSLPSVVATLRYRAGLGEAYPGCNDHLLVRLATGRDPRQVYPRLELVAIDNEGRARVGFERWAIVKFHWEGEALRAVH